MKTLVLMLALTTLVACGRNGKNGKSGTDGATIVGLDGVSNGVDFSDIDPGLVCAAGGVSIFTFRDNNADGLFSETEEIIKVKALCHGTNGSNGADGEDGVDGVDGTNASITLESIAASSVCPNGGVKITSSQSDAVEVCNGVNGINGEQGLPGVQGIPGLAGSNGQNGQDGQDGRDGVDGTQILPVKFCPKDDSTFPEYGLMIGKELFAVYWGTTPASPKTPQAFLTKLVAGNYQSTGGNNCLFSIE